MKKVIGYLKAAKDGYGAKISMSPYGDCMAGSYFGGWKITATFCNGHITDVTSEPVDHDFAGDTYRGIPVCGNRQELASHYKKEDVTHIL